jgi:ketosteroid isomerase-like protein
VSREGSDDGTLQPALQRAVLRGTPERRTLAGMVTFLERRHGTKPPPGLKEHTWRRLRRDPQRSSAPSTQEAIRRAFVRARLSERREQRLRNPLHVHVRFKGEFAVSDESPRYRDLDLSTWFLDQADLVGDVLDAFQAGDPDGMDEAFAEALENEIGAAIHFNDVDSIMFD